MNIFTSIWQSIKVGIFSILVATHLVAPVPTNPQIINNITPPQIATSTISATTTSVIVPVSKSKPPTTQNIKKSEVTPVVEKILPPKTNEVMTSIATTSSTSAPITNNLSLPTTTPPVVTPLPNTTLCNGTYWKQCPAGQDFICSSSGNAFCQLPQQPIQQPPIQTVQTITTPPVPQGPSPAQQVACQQAYDLGVASLQLGYQSQSAQIEAKYEQDLVNMQDYAGNHGTAGSGLEGSLEQGLLATRDRTLSSLTAQYGLNVSNKKMTLQECLNN